MYNASLEQLIFVEQEIWAIVGESDSGNSEALEKMKNKRVEIVSYKHHFRTLSNTTDFYYQQRFNSSDSEDSLSVQQYLSSLITGNHHDVWNYKKVVSRLRLEPLLDEQLIKLSNGETKRLLIAAALIKNPQVLLLDHPLTGLDVYTREVFSALLKEISYSGINIIIATGPWDIPEAVTHVAVMENRKLVFQCEKKQFLPENFSFSKEVQIDLALLHNLLSSGQRSLFDIVVGMKDVTIHYDGKTILDKVNWTIRQGERWSLSGPNGAGKSTLLSLINGDNPQAYANHIILFDRKRGTGESIWDIKKHIGFVSPELFQYFPVDSSCMHVIESGFHDTVGLFRPAGPQKEKICLQWMQLMNIDKYAGKLFNLVPASAQRLCLLARALVKNPTLLVLDEPSQGLDTAQQQFFTKLVESICAASNVTLIYVSHYKHHIPASVSLNLQLENGKVIRDNTI